VPAGRAIGNSLATAISILERQVYSGRVGWPPMLVRLRKPAVPDRLAASRPAFL